MQLIWLNETWKRLKWTGLRVTLGLAGSSFWLPCVHLFAYVQHSHFTCHVESFFPSPSILFSIGNYSTGQK